jgi:hypothetical protein
MEEEKYFEIVQHFSADFFFREIKFRSNLNSRYFNKAPKRICALRDGVGKH